MPYSITFQKRSVGRMPYFDVVFGQLNLAQPLTDSAQKYTKVRVFASPGPPLSSSCPSLHAQPEEVEHPPRVEELGGEVGRPHRRPVAAWTAAVQPAARRVDASAAGVKVLHHGGRRLLKT